MRLRVASVVVSLVVPVTSVLAQAPWHWRSWSDGPRNTVLVGVGVNTAVLGARYSRNLGDSPIALGVGAGTAGYAPFVELTAPFSRDWGAFPYVGAGVLVSWDPRRHRTTPIVEIGARGWLGKSRRFFTDAGFGSAPGRLDLAVWAMVFPHLQIGVAF